MKLRAELAQLSLDPAAKTQVAAMMQALLDQTKQEADTQLQAQDIALQAKDAEIKRKDFKIEVLTFELALLRRIQLGVKNEALLPLQPDLFAETLVADSAAIEVELEQLTAVQPATTVAKPQRPRAGRKMLLHFLH